MTEPTTPEPAPSARLGVRFALVLVALALISLMNRALGAAVEEYSRTFAIPTLLVAAYVALAMLGGLAMGLAAMLPRRLPVFHWRRALVLAVLPALVVALNVVAFTSPGVLPGWFSGIEFLYGLHVATVAAALVGVAAASAFAET